MLKGRRLTAVVPARAGSRRIAGKNRRRVGCHTLVERAIKLALGCPLIDRTLVSTDDPEIQRSAETLGIATPALRPAELASDSASTIDVLLHLIDTDAIEPGYLLLLQPTSPLRTRADLDALCAAFESAPEADAAVSLCRHEGAHPEKLQQLEGGRVKSYLGTDSHRPAQSLPELFALNGAFYLVDLDVVREQRTLLPERTIAYLMPPERSMNLDTETDWQILDAMLAAGSWAVEEYE